MNFRQRFFSNYSTRAKAKGPSTLLDDKVVLVWQNESDNDSQMRSGKRDRWAQQVGATGGRILDNYVFPPYVLKCRARKAQDGAVSGDENKFQR